MSLCCGPAPKRCASRTPSLIALLQAQQWYEPLATTAGLPFGQTTVDPGGTTTVGLGDVLMHPPSDSAVSATTTHASLAAIHDLLMTPALLETGTAAERSAHGTAAGRL